MKKLFLFLTLACSSALTAHSFDAIQETIIEMQEAGYATEEILAVTAELLGQIKDFKEFKAAQKLIAQLTSAVHVTNK
jgi:hypothetical protein